MTERPSLVWLRRLLVAAPAAAAGVGVLLALPGAPAERLWAALPWGPAPGTDLLTNAAEVVAAVLAVAITVVAIVLELAATRYTHRITQLFVREPANLAVMSLFVGTTLLCLWMGAAPGPGEAPPHRAAGFAIGLVTLCLVLLLPYFGFVFAFLGPESIVDRLRRHALRAAERGRRRPSARTRLQLLEGVEELEDLALNAIQRADRGIAVSAVQSLSGVLEKYAALRTELPPEWLRLGRELEDDPDFAALDASEREDIDRAGTWVEVKVLRQLHTLFAHALNRVPDVPASVAVETATLARRAARSDPALLDLSLRFLNSYLRAAVNAADVRSAYYLLQQCRVVLEALLGEGQDERSVRMAQHLRSYALLAQERGLPFVAETLAYDLALLVDGAFEGGRPAAWPLLEVLLRVDRPAGPGPEAASLHGVRRAQAQLAARRLARGDTRSAERIRRDMRSEERALLAAVRQEILAADEQRFWEFTDRAAHFAWLPPELHKHVDDFFAGLGLPLAERQRKEEREPGADP